MFGGLHAQFFHDGYEFATIGFGVGAEHWKVPKETDIVCVFKLIYVHASQAGHTIEIVIATPVGITIGCRTDQAGMSDIKFVAGFGSSASCLKNKFTCSHDNLLVRQCTACVAHRHDAAGGRAKFGDSASA